MFRHERLKKLKPEDFKRAMGVNPKTFKLMLKLLTQAHEEKMKNGGRPCMLSIEDQLIMSLKYLRDYPALLLFVLILDILESRRYPRSACLMSMLLEDLRYSALLEEGMATGENDLD